jgi:hypothetical protein
LKILGFPVVYYTPETRWALGATSITTIKDKSDSTNHRPSSIQFGFAYTQLKQILFYLPYQLWLKNNSINIQGELGYYIYNYYFYGVGNNFPEGYREIYDITFPRIRVAFLRQIKQNQFIGIKLGYDNFLISNLVNGGSLSSDSINGNRGGMIAPIGIIFKIDNRDNLFYASRGVFLETYFEITRNGLLSNYSYSKFSIDISTYKKVTKSAIIAANGFLQHSSGNVPFFQLPGLGGSKKMRGFYEFSYRDKNAWVIQAEWRQQIYKAFGGAFFLGVGEVKSKEINIFQNVRGSYGAGIRAMLDKKQKINLRLDVGVGRGKTNYYFTILEAF